MKVIPNILEPLLDDAPYELRRYATAQAFTAEEQCIRLVGHCVGRQLVLSSLGEPTLDEKYESLLATFLPEHPFIAGRQFRNAVFEALALASLIASRNPESESLMNQYLASHKHSYHLVYMLDIILSDRRIPIGALGPLFAAAMEFRSVHSVVELRVNGPDCDCEVPGWGVSGEIAIEVDIILGADKSVTQTFSFRGEITPESRLFLGSRLAGAFISVPCQVQLGGTHELELTAPVEITATSVKLDARALVLRSLSPKGEQQEVIVESHRLESSLETIITNGIPLVFALADMTGVSFPAVQYV